MKEWRHLAPFGLGYGQGPVRRALHKARSRTSVVKLHSSGEHEIESSFVGRWQPELLSRVVVQVAGSILPISACLAHCKSARDR